MADLLLPGEYERIIRVGARDRSYLLHIPDRPAARYPLVLAFHGSGSNAAGMRDFCGLNEKSNSAGFIVVYPEGSGRAARALTWNAGNCCGHAVRQQVDDVGFVKAILTELRNLLPVDEGRVFATGMSNGAMLSYRLASEMADCFAAVAAVGGPMGTETCHPSRPVSVLHFHGTNDFFAPYRGGRGVRSLSQAHVLSVEHTIAAWVRANECSPVPTITQLPRGPTEVLWAERATYGPGREGSEVVLYTMHGVGHTWPGRVPHWDFLGPALLTLPGNDLIWEFFCGHARG